MKILIVRLSSLGDIVLTQPASAVLRKQYPQAQIDYLTKPGFVPIVQSFGTIDNIYRWDNKKEVVAKLRKNKYDLLIDLHRKFNTFLIKISVGARKNITYKKYHFHRKLLTWHMTNKPNETTVNLNLKVLKKIGINKQNILPEIYSDPEYLDAVKKMLDIQNINPNKKLIAIFPGALHETKRYPLENLNTFIKQIPEDWNCHFLLLGSKNENSLTAYLKEENEKKCTDLCGKIDLYELISLLDLSDVVISNDSGPMHMAAALKKDQIALFGATHTSLGFAPQNPKARILQLNLDCQPCSLHGAERCPKKHFKCMNDLKPEELQTELGLLLKINL